MPRTETQDLFSLYEADETAWLEMMAQLVSQRRLEDLDLDHLCEYLTDMATRDRREVHSRLVILLAHLLKWEYQEVQRSKSWRKTIRLQRDDLTFLLESKTLRNFAESDLVRAYESAVLHAAAETDLDENHFPRTCPWTLEEILEKKLDS